jgi:hypothetical protein
MPFETIKKLLSVNFPEGDGTLTAQRYCGTPELLWQAIRRKRPGLRR